MKKNIHPVVAWSLICGIAIIVLLMMFVQLQQSMQKPTSSQTSKEAMVVIDYGNGKMRRFKGPIEENARAWDLFQQALAIGGISVNVTDHFVPQVIDGLKDGAGGKHWSIYVNNTKQKFTPFEIQVKPGDEVVFKFE